MLKVFGNFDRARINRASECDKLRRFSPAAQLRSSTLGNIFVHFVAPPEAEYWAIFTIFK